MFRVLVASLLAIVGLSAQMPSQVAQRQPDALALVHANVVSVRNGTITRDVVSLANALVHAVNAPAERRRRGARGADVARERYSWPALAGEVAGVYDSVCGVAPAVS